MSHYDRAPLADLRLEQLIDWPHLVFARYFELWGRGDYATICRGLAARLPFANSIKGLFGSCKARQWLRSTWWHGKRIWYRIDDEKLILYPRVVRPALPPEGIARAKALARKLAGKV